MAIDYSLIRPQYETPAFNFAGGFQEQELANALQNQIVNDPALSAYAALNPVDALKMKRSEDLSMAKSGSSVFEKKARAAQTPEAKAIVDKYKSVAQAAVQKRIDNPKSNISTEINQLAGLEQDYFTTTGIQMPNKITNKMINNLAKEKSDVLKEQDDVYAAAEKITNRVMSETDKTLSNYRAGAKDITNAIRLMQGGDPDSVNTNGTQIASAIKMYVKSLDNSVVNAGEIGAVAGGDLIDKVISFANELSQGVRYSESQLQNFFSAMKSTAETADMLIDRQSEFLNAEAENSLSNLVTTGVIDEEMKAQLAANIQTLINNRMSKYKTGLGGEDITAEFSDIDLFSGTPKRKSTGGSGRSKVSSAGGFSR